MADEIKNFFNSLGDKVSQFQGDAQALFKDYKQAAQEAAEKNQTIKSVREWAKDQASKGKQYSQEAIDKVDDFWKNQVSPQLEKLSQNGKDFMGKAGDWLSDLWKNNKMGLIGGGLALVAMLFGGSQIGGAAEGGGLLSSLLPILAIAAPVVMSMFDKDGGVIGRNTGWKPFAGEEKKQDGQEHGTPNSRESVQTSREFMLKHPTQGIQLQTIQNGKYVSFIYMAPDDTGKVFTRTLSGRKEGNQLILEEIDIVKDGKLDRKKINLTIDGVVNDKGEIDSDKLFKHPKFQKQELQKMQESLAAPGEQLVFRAPGPTPPGDPNIMRPSRGPTMTG